MLQCTWKQTTGIDCMGCGTQRSILALLEGDIAASISLYPALIPMVLMVVILAGHLIFKFKYGAEVLKWWFIATAGIALVNWFFNTIWPFIVS